MNKKRLRRIYRTKRRNLSPLLRRYYSKKICQKLLDWPLFRSSESIFFYHPIDKEVDTQYLFDHDLLENTRFIFPKTDPETRRIHCYEIHHFEKHLSNGCFDIMEPVSCENRTVASSEIDLVLVPGLVFDYSGHRIGFGGGYFDRFLSNEKLTATTVGLGYSFQLIKKLPAEKHDETVDYILTEIGFTAVKQ
ncbi:MAG: 5-formyltetrahydrofolate cyclo-ligase [bacterium]